MVLFHGVVVTKFTVFKICLWIELQEEYILGDIDSLKSLVLTLQ